MELYVNKTLQNNLEYDDENEACYVTEMADGSVWVGLETDFGVKVRLHYQCDNYECILLAAECVLMLSFIFIALIYCI